MSNPNLEWLSLSELHQFKTTSHQSQVKSMAKSIDTETYTIIIICYSSFAFLENPFYDLIMCILPYLLRLQAPAQKSIQTDGHRTEQNPLHIQRKRIHAHETNFLVRFIEWFSFILK